MMVKIFCFLCVLLLTGCKITPQDEPVSRLQAMPPTSQNLDQLELELKQKGYKTFLYKDEDTTFLMQEYYVVFLKTGTKRDQDSSEVVILQREHLKHLSRMYREGHTSLTGPMAAEGDLRGIVVYNTATAKEADSLAKLDPMVKAGRLKVEVLPWWAAKGSKLK